MGVLVVWVEVVVVVVMGVGVGFEGLGALGTVLLAIRPVVWAAPGVSAPLCSGPRCPAARRGVWRVVGAPGGGSGGGGGAGGGGGGDAFESGVILQLLDGTHAVLLRREHRDWHHVVVLCGGRKMHATIRGSRVATASGGRVV